MHDCPDMDPPIPHPIIHIQGQRPDHIRPFYSSENLLDLVEPILPAWMVEKIKTMHDRETTDPQHIAKSDHESRHWSNPLACRLPQAPDYHIYSFYGVGFSTERAYEYRMLGKTVEDLSLDTALNEEGKRLEKGVYYCDGDESVPLISLGLMNMVWQRLKHYNPAGVHITVKEQIRTDTMVSYSTRGGPAAAHHIDILGNHEVLGDIVRIATDFLDDLPEGRIAERIHSDIRAIAGRVDLIAAHDK